VWRVSDTIKFEKQWHNTIIVAKIVIFQTYIKFMLFQVRNYHPPLFFNNKGGCKLTSKNFYYCQAPVAQVYNPSYWEAVIIRIKVRGQLANSSWDSIFKITRAKWILFKW
jgi:hypothetical protein